MHAPSRGGVRTPRDIRELKEWQPEVHEQLFSILRELEQHYGDSYRELLYPAR